MKTQYFRRPKRSFSIRQGIVALVIVLILLVLFLLRVFVPGALTALSTPFWSVGDFFTAHARLTKDAGTLQKEVDALATQNETLKNENAALHAMLGETARLPDERGIAAGVLSRPPLSPYDVLIIGKGSADGIYAGMRAFSRSVPIGVVEGVSGASARVVLYSASGKTTDGWVGEKRVPVTLHGLGAGAFTADVPRDAAVAEGDAVYLPGPGALPMGVVASIESNASSPRSTLHIRPSANPFTMTEVIVVAAPAP